jgi:hypothetical protein
MPMRGRVLVSALLVLSAVACTSNDASKAGKSSSDEIANIAGIWHIVADTPSGVHEATMFVEQAGNQMKGRFEGDLGVMHFAGTVGAQDVQFSHQAMAGSMQFDYTGSVKPEELQGTAVFGTLGSGTWKAQRVKAQ